MTQAPVKSLAHPLLSPKSGKLGLRGNCAHFGGSAASRVHSLDPRLLGALDRNARNELRVAGHKRRSEDGQSWEDDPLIMDTHGGFINEALDGDRSPLCPD